MRQKWEYRVILVTRGVRVGAAVADSRKDKVTERKMAKEGPVHWMKINEAVMNEAGSEGWELVSQQGDEYQWNKYAFRRPLD